MSERERFEAWANGRLRLDYLKHRTGGAYMYQNTQAAWEAWQAAKAEAAEERKALVADMKLIHSLAYDDAHGIDDADTLDKIRAIAYAAQRKSKEASDDQ